MCYRSGSGRASCPSTRVWNSPERTGRETTSGEPTSCLRVGVCLARQDVGSGQGGWRGRASGEWIVVLRGMKRMNGDKEGSDDPSDGGSEAINIAKCSRLHRVGCQRLEQLEQPCCWRLASVLATALPLSQRASILRAKADDDTSNPTMNVKLEIQSGQCPAYRLRWR